MDRKIVLIGGFVEIIELCEENCIEIMGIVDKKESCNNKYLKYIGSDSDVEDWINNFRDFKLLITPDIPKVRKNLYSFYAQHGFTFTSLISGDARISKSATLGIGVIVQSGVNISSEVTIGNFVKINTNANIMHNSNVGDYSTIAPNAVILGHVNIGNTCYIGANTTILPHVKICNNVTIGAGAVVTKNINTPGTIYVGIPAKPMNK